MALPLNPLLQAVLHRPAQNAIHAQAELQPPGGQLQSLIAAILGHHNTEQNVDAIARPPGYAMQHHDPHLWLERHPYAASHGQIPPWVAKAEAGAAHGPAQHLPPVPVDISHPFRANIPGAGPMPGAQVGQEPQGASGLPYRNPLRKYVNLAGAMGHPAPHLQPPPPVAY